MIIACGEHSCNSSSTPAPFVPYIRVAQGQPAGRRIPQPPGCLPRVTLGRAAVDAVDFEYNYASIGHILDRIRDAGGKVSPDFYPDDSIELHVDRNRLARQRRTELGQSISIAFTFRKLHADFWDDRRAVRRFSRLAEIAKASAKLHALLLEDDGQAQSALAPHLSSSHLHDGLFAMMTTLGQITAAAELARENLHENRLDVKAPLSHLLIENKDVRAQATPGDSLMTSLAEIFRKFFEDEPVIFQDETREPYGPFLSFVMTVREEVGEPVTADAVRRAWDRARASQDTMPET